MSIDKMLRKDCPSGSEGRGDRRFNVDVGCALKFKKELCIYNFIFSEVL